MTWWKRALGALGVHVVTATDAPSFDEELARLGRYVFVLNDDVSPMVEVTRWLEASFDLTRAEAAKVMAIVKNHGFGAVGPFEAGRARDLVIQARFEATKRGLSALQFSTDVPPPEVLSGARGAVARRS